MADPIDIFTKLSRAESINIGRRRRGRNWAMLAMLVGLSALFYAVAVVKLGGTLLQAN